MTIVSILILFITRHKKPGQLLISLTGLHTINDRITTVVVCYYDLSISAYLFFYDDLISRNIFSISINYYTATFFHLPLLNRTYAQRVMAVSATGTAINTPVGPKFKYSESKYANGIWKNQNPKRFIHVGVHVSPAPLNAFAITIPIP